MLQAIGEIAGADPATAASVNFYLQKCDDTYANRTKKLEAITEAYEANDLAQTLRLGPVSHHFKTELTADDGSSAGGSDNTQTASAAIKAKPVPPFPFKFVNRLEDEDVKKRLDLVHQFNRKLKEKRSGELVECVICHEVIPSLHDAQHCDDCLAIVHCTCLTTDDCGWLVQEGENRVFCTKCRAVHDDF